LQSPCWFYSLSEMLAVSIFLTASLLLLLPIPVYWWRVQSLSVVIYGLLWPPSVFLALVLVGLVGWITLSVLDYTCCLRCILSLLCVVASVSASDLYHIIHCLLPYFNLRFDWPRNFQYEYKSLKEIKCGNNSNYRVICA
jgi:hypothetical protein